MSPVGLAAGLVAWLPLIRKMIMPAYGATYYVDADAMTAGSGSMQEPFATIQQAANLLEPGDACVIRKGVYRETVVPARSGTPEVPIVFRAHEGQKVVISGCDPVQDWTQDKGSIYFSETELSMGHENQVFADGAMMWEARWPNVGGTTPEYLLEFQVATMKSGTTSTKIVDPDLPERDWSDATVWVASHKRWFCWTGRVTDHGKGFVTLENNADKKGNHNCRPGGDYYLFGARAALDTENEWYYDSRAKRLYVWMPRGDSPSDRVEVKRRRYAFDLRGKSHIHIKDLTITGASVATDNHSERLIMDGLRMVYLDHSSKAETQYQSQLETGLLLAGAGHVVRNCEIAFSSGNGIVLAGRDHQVINNYIHDCNYIGSYAAPLLFFSGGRGQVVSHNTLKRAGRSCINTEGLYDSLLQWNDVGFAGYLTYDLGLTYGNGVEGGNSEIRYNWFHNNVSKGQTSMGVYFDHGCKNIMVHHNVIAGGSHAGLKNNQYANYLLYYNNTVSGEGYSFRSDWAAGQKKDLYGCRLFNNVGTQGVLVTGQGLAMGANTWEYEKLVKHKYLAPGSAPVDAGVVIKGITHAHLGNAPDQGAYELGGEKWVPGHNVDHPPGTIDTQRSKPLHRNLIRNTAFYNGQTDSWERVGKQVEIIEDFHDQSANTKTMMGGYSISLSEAGSGIRQTVEGLDPDTTYELMGMFRVEGDATAFLVVDNGRGGEQRSEAVANTKSEWQRRTLHFTTAPQQTTVIVSARKSDRDGGIVYVDDMGLQRQD